MCFKVIILFLMLQYSLRSEPFGFRNPVGSRFSTPVYTGHEANPPFYLKDMVAPSQGASDRGVALINPPTSSFVVKERVELYFWHPSVPSWHVIGWTWQRRSLLYLNRHVTQVAIQAVSPSKAMCYYNTSDTNTNPGDAHTTKSRITCLCVS